MSAKTIDLRGLTDAERYEPINRTMAENLGWQDFFYERGVLYATPRFNGQLGADAEEVPRYATSADAVLPLLEKSKFVVIVFAGTTWSVEINEKSGEGETYNVVTIGEDDGPTLALTACIALLRANGYEVLT